MTAGLRIALLALASSMVAANAARADEPPKSGYDLARANGCMICHEVEARDAGAPLPSAPTFQDVARRYRSDPDAATRLTSVVLYGSAPVRRDRHWAGKVTFDTMYPNDLMVSEAEARRIVDCILALDRRRARDDGAPARERVQ